MSSVARWIIITILLICFCVWFLTPLRSPSNSQVVGQYQVALPWGEGFLQLNTDHTFREVVHLRTGENHEIKGEWALSRGWQSSLSLRPYWQFTQHDPGTRAESVTLPVESWGFRNVQIELGDFDSGVKLRKK
jgi:hypothetical protein